MPLIRAFWGVGALNESNIVYIGQKPIMNYVLAVVKRFGAGNTDLIIQARGKSISKAVDVALISVDRSGGELALGDINPDGLEETLALVRATDVNVVTFRHEPLFFENSPNKFFDGIAAGVPALFNRSTWLEPWLKAYDCGIVCKGERPGEEMAAALRVLAGDWSIRRSSPFARRRMKSA